MSNTMKTHETLIKLKEKQGRYERLCIIKMEKFERIESENNAILSDNSFGKCKIKWSLSNLNPDECIGCIGLNGCCRILILVRLNGRRRI